MTREARHNHRECEELRRFEYCYFCSHPHVTRWSCPRPMCIYARGERPRPRPLPVEEEALPQGSQERSPSPENEESSLEQDEFSVHSYDEFRNEGLPVQ